MYLTGLAIENYRSFGPGLQPIYPMRKVNFIAGQNNSGKSNILRFVSLYLSNGGRGDLLDSELDRHNGDLKAIPGVAIPVRLGDEDIANYVDSAAARLPDESHNRRDAIALLSFLRSAPELQIEDGMLQDLIWIRYRYDLSPAPRSDEGQAFGPHWKMESHDLDSVVTAMNLQGIRIGRAAALLKRSSRGFNSEVAALSAVVRGLSRSQASPTAKLIDAFRQIRAATIDPDPGESPVDAPNDSTGLGLIAQLQKLERPDITKLDDKGRFQSISQFVRALLDDDTVTLEIPSHGRSIYVTQQGHTLPLENLGTGIHQVVMLAAAATLVEGNLVCIEEPEIHLHPLLQRKLVRYLEEETSNQYLIATHSAHMLDHSVSSIFHVTYDGAQSRVASAATPHLVSRICSDLGYRASDLLQANSVVWVEGPSDRVYLKHWLGLVDPDLIEGIDFSIMFYGGRLLNHLSVDDEDVDDFISLRRLNRSSSVVIDSDRLRKGQPINATKRRIRESYSLPDAPGLAWVTAGRTIENYIPITIYRQAFEECYPMVDLIYSGDRYENPMKMSKNLKVDKIKLARAVCRRQNDMDSLDTLDLLRRVRDLASEVRRAGNSIERR